MIIAQNFPNKEFMSNHIHYNNCPVCNSTRIQFVLNAKDHTVSGEEFAVWECEDCSLRFTQDVPDSFSIGPYYKAEEYISHTNTSKGMINRLYQVVRRRTLVSKRKMVEKHTGKNSGSLLDYGSGTGNFANEMKGAGWNVTALEPDEDARKLAAQAHGLEVQPLSEFYSIPPDSFDAITLWHVLEHVHDLDETMAHLKRLLKPGGKLFIAVPNYTSTDQQAYGKFWAAYDVPRHLYHFSPTSMERLAEKHGLRIDEFLPQWYDSFYISLLSSRYKHGNPQWISAGWNGLRSNLKTLRNKKKCSSVVYVIGPLIN